MTTGPAIISSATRRSILLLSFATFSSMTAQRICDAMLPELSRVFSVSLTQASQVISVFAVIYGLAQLLYGPLGDRLGKFRIVTFATLACSLGSLVAVVSTSLDLLVVARAMMALGAAAIIPLALAWIGDSVPHDQIQETLARIGLGTTLGVVSGQLLGGLLTDALGWRWVFGFMSVLFGVVGSLLYSDWRRQISPPGSTGSVKLERRPGFVAQALIIVTGRWSRIVLVVAFIEGATGYGVLAMWATHLHRTMGLTLSMAGAIVALFGLGGVFYMAVAHHLIHRLGERGLVLLGTCTLGLSTLVLAFAPYWIFAIPASLLGGIGFFMFHNTMQANATKMNPTARGTAVSLFASSMFLGQSGGVLMAASLIERVGSGTVIAMGGLVMMAVGLFFAHALHKRDDLMLQL